LYLLYKYNFTCQVKMLVVSSALCQKNFNLSYLVLLFVMIAGYQGFDLTFEPLFYLNKRIDSFIQKNILHGEE
jgi:hypothetical protein